MNKEPINMEAKTIKSMGKIKESKRRSNKRIIIPMLKNNKAKLSPKKQAEGRAR
jgi:hypothetical protein